jgi:hypothetical protein
MVTNSGKGVAWVQLALSSLTKGQQRQFGNLLASVAFNEPNLELKETLEGVLGEAIESTGRVKIPIGKRLRVRIVLPRIEFAVVTDADTEPKEAFKL